MKKISSSEVLEFLDSMIEEIERYLQDLADVACILHCLRGATAVGGGSLPLFCPEAHHNADDLVAFLDQQGSRRGAVHPTAHGYYDSSRAEGIGGGGYTTYPLPLIPYPHRACGDSPQ